MFNQPIPYRYVQTNKTKFGRHKYIREHIYKFFVARDSSRRKIIVEIKEYPDSVFIVDFYATVSHKLKEVRNLHCSKYRYLTNLGRLGTVGATIFSILRELRKDSPDMSFGFQAASLLQEDDDDNNKRFRAYSKIMSFVTGSKNSIWKALVYEENSYIFAIQKRLIHKKESLIIEYGNIFGKISEEGDSH